MHDNKKTSWNHKQTRKKTTKHEGNKSQSGEQNTCKRGEQVNKPTNRKSKWEKQIKHEARKQNVVIKQINENKNKQTQTQNK